MRRVALKTLVGALGIFLVSLIIFGVFIGLDPLKKAFGFAADLYEVFGGNTVFAPGYSEDGWAQIEVGDTQQKVVQIIGQPVSKTAFGREWEWEYANQGVTITLKYDYVTDKLNVAKFSNVEPFWNGFSLIGLSSESLHELLGPPTNRHITKNDIGFWYSLPKGGLGQGNYIQRIVFFDGATLRVVNKQAGLYGD